MKLLLPTAATASAPLPTPAFPADPNLVDCAAQFSAFTTPSPPSPPPRFRWEGCEEGEDGADAWVPLAETAAPSSAPAPLLDA
uniref:Uncharacterized protein n=1 Tax=Oryza meridionalis TaxID=40149 RepID=A0A0E0EBN9_9ORYZ